MIIGKYEIFDVAVFLDGLEKAARATVRIGIESGTKERPETTSFKASGWLITDTLVVVCDYTLTREQYGYGSEQKFYCYPHNHQDSSRGIEAEPVGELPTSSDGSLPALLRLRKALPKCALSLKSESLEIGDLVCIVQYPMMKSTVNFSIGRLITTEGSRLRYDAGTQPGSGGGPILSPFDWTLCGMHTGSAVVTGVVIGGVNIEKLNQGLSLPAMLAAFRESEAWSEIASYHNLADVASARKSLEAVTQDEPLLPDRALLRAALLWSFKPQSFTSEEREQLSTLVIDPSAKVWTMQAGERQSLLQSAGSLDELRKIRGKAKAKDVGQKVIDRILKGPPYDLDKVDEAALPYWLQAVRWFADIEPSLPTPAEINRTLERRRIRSRLQAVAGPDFRGRAKELERLKAWYEDQGAGPLVVSGIGGVGKSALVARFIELLPDNPLLLWLDFDRADLAPDDAISVLSLLSEQLSLQLNEYSKPQISESSWENTAKQIGAALPATPAPVLVLDGFEVAQQVKQHNEIWQVLKLILAAAPNLKIIVSGRAPVQGLDLDGRTADPIHLTGMAAEDALKWLREKGIEDEEVRQRVVEFSEGVPLVLKLALRFIDKGGLINELPENLTTIMVQGFLYDRILDRVIDPLLKPVAKDALVLRRLTQAMIPKVLADTIPKGLDAGEVFSRLSSEMGLVGDEGDPRALSILLPGRADVLHLRPEVRTATLKLLEKDNRERVLEIDRRAADWYAEQDLTEVGNAAELVYHSLRLGDIQRAEKAWVDECALLLDYAEEDLPEAAEAEREWLRARTEAAAPVTGLETWEKEAAERVRSALGRGLLRVVPEILKVREERSPRSPLVLYDAWMRWQDGDVDGAQKSLGDVGEINSQIDRDRAVLAALFAARLGDLARADRLIVSLESAHWGTDLMTAVGQPLVLQAARVRLTVDLRKELELHQLLSSQDPASLRGSDRIPARSDVMLPHLSDLAGPGELTESLGVPVPSSPEDLPGFRARLQPDQGNSRRSPWLPSLDDPLNPDGPWRQSDLIQLEGPPELELAGDLAVLGWRRWRLATESLFLFDACRLVDATDPIALAVMSSLAAFRGYEIYFPSIGESSKLFTSVDEVLDTALGVEKRIITPHPLNPHHVGLAMDVLRQDDEADKSSISLEAEVEKLFLLSGKPLPAIVLNLVNMAASRYEIIGQAEHVADDRIRVYAFGPESKVASFIEDLKAIQSSTPSQLEEKVLSRDYFPRSVISKINSKDVRSVLLFLLGPDPLEMLARRIVGVPDNVPV